MTGEAEPRVRPLPRWRVLGLALLVTACGPYPRDIAGTSDRVAASKVIRVALVAGGDAGERPAIERYIRALESETGARATLTGGAAEPLLAELEEGRYDVAFGSFAIDSPWIDDVTLIEPPLARRRVGKRDVGLMPVARNGENRWIMRLERIAREQGGGK